MKKINPQFSQINYKGLDINILVEPGFVGYAFHYEGNNYGSKLPITTKKKQELLELCFTLCIQAIMSFEELSKKND
jgi:hypothetical protein